jgi:hypothetical protein
VIAAVLAFGDLRDRLADGSTLIRCSAERAASEDLRLLLREDAPRALEVSVVFSEPVRRRLAPTRRRPQGG